MSAPTEERSSFLRFIDAFFQERNIKWMLGIGILILLGSSLMLVTAHWDDYTPLWKYVILLGYTAGIHGLGQLSYHSLALRKTGAGLMALTVLLIPITFLALHWVSPAPLASWVQQVEQAGLFVLLASNTVFTLLAARRIFNHFLLRPQPTFIASYVALAISGAIVPALPASLSPVAALILWAVFAVGATKVNRHVFWLTEEHRLPRIYGFFPILLLGGMYLTLFLVCLAPAIPTTWIGFGLVLTSIPVLMTADALASVFQQRNAAMPRPLPWGIVLPILVGLCMTAAGVCVSGTGFPNTHSLPPTAALAAVVCAVVARRTGKSAFVWLMLGAVLTAYQTCPVFVRETIREIARAGAAAIHEQRMPYAFYGLTYLPLLVVLSSISARLRARGEVLFSSPLRIFSIGLGVLLLMTSVAHAKAVFPVGLALAVLFGLQLVLFRDRRLLPAVIAAIVLAGMGFNAIYVQVLLLPHTDEMPMLAWTVIAGLLLWPGRLIDRSTVFQPDSSNHWQTAPLCRAASLGVLVATIAVWILRATWSGNVAMIVGITCAVLLIVHAWQRADRHVARGAVGYPALLAAILAADAGWNFAAITGVESILLGAFWLAGRSTRLGSVEVAVDPRRPTRDRAILSLRLAAGDVATCGLGGTISFYLLPVMTWTILTGAHFSAWITAVICLLWAVDAAKRRQSAGVTVVAWLLSQATLGALAAAALGWGRVVEWYPVLATLLPSVTIGVLRSNRASESPSRPAIALRSCVVATLAFVAVGSLPFFSLAMRVAGVATFIGLLWSAASWRHPLLRSAAFSVGTWQILAAVLQFASPDLHVLFDLPLPFASSAALAIAAAAALLSMLWNTAWIKQRTFADSPILHRIALLLICGTCIGNTVLQRRVGLSIVESALAGATFLLLIAERVWAARRCVAVRDNDDLTAAENQIWLAEAIAASALVYFCIMGVLSLTGTLCLFAPLIVGIALYAIARATAASMEWRCVSAPFEKTGLILPALTVLVAIIRHAALPAPEWLGINSLALLLSAGFYFWRGLEERSRGLLIGSTAILNLALALLWRDLSLSDPQFFMIPLGLSLLVLVELLKGEIATDYVDPLRYVGALTILVSPTFHIIEGSWLHLLMLLIVSVLVTLIAIGLRVRALMYAGTAFLAADLVAMVVRGSLDNTSLLWIVGILMGAAVIGLAAYCERHRELMLQRLRMIAARLESWE